MRVVLLLTLHLPKHSSNREVEYILNLQYMSYQFYLLKGDTCLPILVFRNANLMKR